MIKKIVLFFLMIILGLADAQAQFLKDKTATDQTLRALDYLYNLQFTQAEAEFASVKAKYGDHPVVYLWNAILVQWKNIPIDQKPAALKIHQSELQKCVDAANKYYSKPEYTEESIFFLVAGYGFLALVENYKENYLNAAQEGRKLIRYFKESKKLKNDNPEFLFISGLYNYYRERYPEQKPIIKPLMVFFESGNKSLGLRELEQAYRNSIFSRIEAATYLWDIYIKYETNFSKAASFSGALARKYPDNFVFRIMNIESLLLNAKFDEAENLTKSLAQNTNTVATLAYNTFKGYLAEHKYKNLDEAKAYYQKAERIKQAERYTRQYKAYTYLGLARIAAAEGDKTAAKNYYKSCLQYADYIWMITLAKNELKSVS